LYDNVDDQNPLWVMDNWNLSDDAFSGFAAYTDSPGGNYAPNTDHTLTTMNILDLGAFDHVELKFWSKWAMESRFDFCRVEVSPDSGGTWQSLPVTYARHGSGAGVQSPAAFGFDGFSPGMEW